MECVFHKLPAGILVPADPMTEDFVDSLGAGEGVRCKVHKARNIHFHKKFFAMLRVGYDAWEPPPAESDHGAPQKNFDQFRADVIILAGYYTMSVRLNGDTRVLPKSISFGQMDELEFNSLYSNVANVLLQRVLTNYTYDDLEGHVAKLLSFT